MTPESHPNEVAIEVYLDGRFVAAVPLPADVLARAGSADRPDANGAFDTCRRSVAVGLPPRGRLRVVIDLLTPPPMADDALRTVTQYAYDGTGTVEVAGQGCGPVSDFATYDAVGPAPDEPHVAS